MLVTHLKSENFRQNVIGGSENHGLSIAISYCQKLTHNHVELLRKLQGPSPTSNVLPNLISFLDRISYIKKIEAGVRWEMVACLGEETWELYTAGLNFSSLWCWAKNLSILHHQGPRKNPSVYSSLKKWWHVRKPLHLKLTSYNKPKIPPTSLGCEWSLTYGTGRGRNSKLLLLHFSQRTGNNQRLLDWCHGFPSLVPALLPEILVGYAAMLPLERCISALPLTLVVPTNTTFLRFRKKKLIKPFSRCAAISGQEKEFHDYKIQPFLLLLSPSGLMHF